MTSWWPSRAKVGRSARRAGSGGWSSPLPAGSTGCSRWCLSPGSDAPSWHVPCGPRPGRGRVCGGPWTLHRAHRSTSTDPTRWIKVVVAVAVDIVAKFGVAWKAQGVVVAVETRDHTIPVGIEPLPRVVRASNAVVVSTVAGTTARVQRGPSLGLQRNTLPASTIPRVPGSHDSPVRWGHPGPCLCPNGRARRTT